MPDKDGYPTEDELRRIKEWDVCSDLMGLLRFIEDLWFYSDRFILKGKRVLRLYLSTGGWSGNEDIIIALEENFVFWTCFWQKSTIGGHYWFKFKLFKSDK